MKRKSSPRRVTRRKFIEQGTRIGAGAAVTPLVLQLGACAADDPDDEMLLDDSPDGGGGPVADDSPDGDDGPSADDASSDDPSAGGPIADGAVLLGLYPGDGEAAMRAAAARLDFSWLGEGDSVLIKVACNSGNAHPATTSPAGVRGMVAELKERGAGRVIVADQAGVEHVRLSAAGRFASTREMFESNGLAELEADAELHFFDDGGFEDGYVEATLPEANRWPRGMYIAKIITEVDHIIYMPRISAHTLAGLTNAQKSAIGWLRDDSRHDLHRDAAEFYEKYAEVNYVEEIASRVRMAVTVSEQVQLFGGPDEGTAFTMEPPLVLASSSLANHDAMAASVLVTLHQVSGAAPSGMTYNSGFAPTANTFFANGVAVATGAAGTWTSGAPSTRYTAHAFEGAPTGERAVARGWELSGGAPESIEVQMDGEEMAADLKSGIESHGGGLYTMG